MSSLANAEANCGPLSDMYEDIMEAKSFEHIFKKEFSYPHYVDGF